MTLGLASSTTRHPLTPSASRRTCKLQRGEQVVIIGHWPMAGWSGCLHPAFSCVRRECKYGTHPPGPSALTRLTPHRHVGRKVESQSNQRSGCHPRSPSSRVHTAYHSTPASLAIPCICLTSCWHGRTRPLPPSLFKLSLDMRSVPAQLRRKRQKDKSALRSFS